jgi:hypothetical protein
MDSLGILHFVIFLFTITYVFLFPTATWVDILFIYYFLLVNIHWTFLNGECVIAYIYKKFTYDDYYVGKDPVDISDIGHTLEKYLGIPLNVFNVLLICMLALYIVNVYIVLIRNEFPDYVIVILISAYVTYLCLLRSNLCQLTYYYTYIHYTLYITVFVVYTVYLLNEKK